MVGDDGALDFHYVSTACAEIFGFPAEAAMADARYMHDSIHPLDRHSFREAGQEALEQVTTLRWEGRIVRPDGALRLVTITSRPQQHADDETLWHGLVVDRTTLAHWATNSGEARDGPGRIDGDTLSILGHDIGTPLTAITAAAELAMETLESPPSSGSGRHGDLVRCLWTVQRNAARLELLRNGLLNMVSSDTGRLTATPAPVLLRPRLEAAVALVQRPSRVAVECPEGLTCSVQPSHLDQMILNLLINADKYAGGAVAVQAAPEGDDVTITIEDHGPGVPPEFRDELFTRFTRHETTTGLPGTGLGLYIVHELATANLGSVAYAPGNDRGSRFSLTFPHAQHSTQAS